MGTEQGNPGEAQRSDWRSILLSVVIHMTLFVALALIWTTRVINGGEEGPRRVHIVLASAGEEPEYFDEAEVNEQEASEAVDTMQQALPDEQPPIDITPIVSEIAPIDLPLPGFNSSEMATPDRQTSSARNIRLTDEQKRMLAEESAALAARRPKGPPTTLSVFGSGELSGRKFVFVIDRSKSMGAQGLNVLNIASSELSGAINTLEDYHQFQIVAYHHRTVAMERRSLLNATEVNKREVNRFISDLAAFGGTEHEVALTTALSMGPDVVVMLTDGGLPGLNESQLLRIRRIANGAQIHCFHFGSGPDQKRDNFMKKLAGQNMGTYRYIDVTRLDQ